MKIEVTNTPDDLRELVNRATVQKDYLVDLITGRAAAKDNAEAANELLETWLDMLQLCDGLQYDINRAIAHIPFHPEHAE